MTTQEEHPIHHAERHVEWTMWCHNSKLIITVCN